MEEHGYIVRLQQLIIFNMKLPPNNFTYTQKISRGKSPPPVLLWPMGLREGESTFFEISKSLKKNAVKDIYMVDFTTKCPSEEDYKSRQQPVIKL